MIRIIGSYVYKLWVQQKYVKYENGKIHQFKLKVHIFMLIVLW